jgi:hypothetical protein
MLKTAAQSVYFATAIMWVLMLYPVMYLLFTGDYSGPQNFYGLQEDDRLVDVVFTVREMFIR